MMFLRVTSHHHHNKNDTEQFESDFFSLQNQSQLSVMIKPSESLIDSFKLDITIKHLLTELGRSGQESVWLSVMAHRPHWARSVRLDLEPKIFPFGPPSQSINKRKRVI